MTRILLVGGARSGKSTLAERLVSRFPRVDYVATGYPPDPSDAEWSARVGAHRARRPAHWTTHETLDVAGLLGRPGPPLLVDCLTLWLTRVMDGCGAWESRAGWEEALAAETARLAAAWRSTARTVVAVTNDVGSGVVPDTGSGRLFRDEAGRLSAVLGAHADTAYLVVAGRALPLLPPGEPAPLAPETS